MATKNHILIWVVVCLFFCCTLQETILVESITEDTAENDLTSLKGEVIATSDEEVKIDQKAEEGQLEGGILINQGKGEYYYAEITAVNGTVHIHAIDEDLHESEIIIKKQNPVKYIDSLKNLILLKQVIRQQSTTQSSSSGTSQPIIHQDIAAYYILTLQTQNHTSSTQFLTFTQQHINPQIDDSSYTLAQGYVLTQILQYDQVNQFVYVLMRGYSHQQIITYKIDLGKKSETLITVSWLKSSGDNVLGGNGKTLIDVDKLEVLDYPQNETVNLYEETKFVRTQLASVVNTTETPIYTSELVTIPLAGSFFMLLSQQTTHQNVTSILFEGYTHSSKQSVQVSHLHNLTDSTNNKITVFTDEYESVLIITRENALFVEVEWNQTEKKFAKSVVRLEDQIKDEAQWKEILRELNMAQLAVYNDDKLYVLTSQHQFIVYSTATYTKLHEEIIVKSPAVQSQPQTPLVAKPPITTSEQLNSTPTTQPPAPTDLALPPHSTWQDMVTLFRQIKAYSQKPTL